jgi:hypothetical protein
MRIVRKIILAAGHAQSLARTQQIGAPRTALNFGSLAKS